MKNILLIEDDPDVAETLRSLLREFGYDVETAADGISALRTLRTGYQPHVILLDLMMPNMDGHRFREVQVADAKLSSIPTVVITADPRATAARLGVRACFRKPFDPERLLHEIDGILAAPDSTGSSTGSAKQ
jgi:CheY-like chemotaxis protein